MGRGNGPTSNKKRKKEDSLTSAGSATATAATSSSTSQKRKKAATDATSSAAAATVFYQEYCELPFSLRTILVDEFHYITRKGFDSPHGYDNDCELMGAGRPARSVHELPAKVTVRQVLQHYQRKRAGGGSSSNSDDDKDKEKRQQTVWKFCEGLALLFDDALPVCLLYAEERPQYESLWNDEVLKLKRPCEIYPAIFLLRLLDRLPRLLAVEPQSEVETMGPLIADLIVLLQKNRQACFMKDSYCEPRGRELLPWENEARNG